MAETKTTIPVEIKMGNAGTNDANLPAFKEGSIIFTKDTKKIYIDPVGETERIAVGGTEVAVDSELSKTSTNPVQNKVITNAMVGKKFGTSEVFNDYNDNKTYKYEGVRVINVRNTTNNSIFTLESVAGLTVGGTFLVICKNNDNESFRVYSIRYIIASINVADRTITTTTKYSGPSTSRYSLYVLDSTATEATPIYSAYSHAEGRFTTASGRYSHAQNLYTIAGYDNQTAMGKYNSNKTNTLLEVGNGTSEQDRSNAFEVYNDGHAEVQTQGSTDNSVVIKSELENKQDKFANITNPGICKVTMSNPGQTYFCNNSSDSGIYFDSSIRLLQGKGIKNDDDLINKKYVDDETAKKQDIFADLDYVWDGDSFKYLSLNLKNAIKKTFSTSGAISIVSDLRLSTELGEQVSLTVGAITVDPIDNGRYSSSLSNTFLRFKDREASATLPSMLITPTAHNGTTPAYLTFASPAQNTAVGNANVRLTGIAAPTADNDAVNRGYLTTKYGSTYYESQDKQYYLPSGSNMVIPNTNMGRLFIGSESAVSTDFKIYVNDPIDGGKLIITNLKTPTNNEDAVNKAYVDTQVATKQAKFAEYTSTRPSEEAPASASTNILVLNEGTEFYLRDRATNPLVEFKINNAGALQGTTNNLSLTTKNTFNLKSNIFTLSNDNDDIFQVVMDDSKKVVYYGLKGGDDNGSLYLTNTSRTAQQGATLQGNVSSDARTTALVVNESNTKLLSWKQGTTTNNAPLLGVSTPVATADTSKGITADDLDYQAVNKKYVDDIKTELLDAITHPYTYDETTKELTLIL